MGIIKEKEYGENTDTLNSQTASETIDGKDFLAKKKQRHHNPTESIQKLKGSGICKQKNNLVVYHLLQVMLFWLSLGRFLDRFGI